MGQSRGFMSRTAEELLLTFESLSPTEQQQVVAEILRRLAVHDPESALNELAAELFRGYDAEEADHGKP
jgi:hypothetical protein